MALKPKKCRICRNKFQPWNSLAKVCSPKCAIQDVIEATAKKERKSHKEAKDRIKARADWTREAQTQFNRYIRARDKGKPCISCDKPDNGGHQRHASHYRPAGICTQLRFHHMNVHSSCAQCNSMRSGNLIEYRIRLVEKIGVDSVEWLESQRSPHTWDIDDLKEIKAIYSKMARDLEKTLLTC